jgi:monolysocardiolipin acyltransferase
MMRMQRVVNGAKIWIEPKNSFFSTVAGAGAGAGAGAKEKIKSVVRAVVSNSLVFSVAIGGAVYYRPLPDLAAPTIHLQSKTSKEEEEGGGGGGEPTLSWGHNACKEPLEVSATDRKRYMTPFFHASDEALEELNSNREEGAFSLLCARYLTVGVVNLLVYFGMNFYNTFHAISSYDDEVGHTMEERATCDADTGVCELGPKTSYYNNFIERILERTEGAALISVSNHCSTLDDPALFATFVPFKAMLSQRSIPWSLCSQEICFKSPAVAAFFGAAQVLPIKRGAGIGQPLLHDFARKVANGDWVHMFPEGQVSQSTELGANYVNTRSKEDTESMGKLKWGVGKLIAHSSVPISIVPFHHVGMEGTLPQNKEGVILSKIPQGGNTAIMRVGKDVVVKDLIAAYEKLNGKEIRKYYSSKTKDGEMKWAQSSEAELQLYSDITRRIQESLELLERDARTSTKEEYVKAYAKKLVYE